MKSVVLVNPNINIVDKEKDHYSILEHLGMGLIASSIERAGYHVIIIDGYALNLPKDHVVEKIKEIEPSFVGITCNYIGFKDAIEMARSVSEMDAAPFVFMGGEHCTYSSQEILENYSFINAVVRGEGEQIVVDLLKNVDNMEKVRGVWFRDPQSGVIVKNPDQKAISDLDTIPFARRDTLEHCKDNNETTIIGMLTQRGCNLNCHFCNAHEFFRLGGGRVIRRRTPKNIADELKELYHDYYSYGIVEKVYFYDANFIDGSRESKKWAFALADEIITRGIVMPFEVYMRGDSISDKDGDLIDHLKKAGLDAVFIGIESFDQADLNVFGKNIQTDQLAATINLLVEKEVFGLTQGLIMFNPYSTVEGLKNTARFLLHYRLCSFWNLSQKLQLFPGVKLIDTLRSDALLNTSKNNDDVYSYSFESPLIEKIADYLIALNDNRTVINDNAIPRYIIRSLSVLEQQLSDYPIAKNILASEKRLLDGKIERINELNFDYFNRVIDMFTENRSQDDVDRFTQTYLSSSEQLVTDLNSSFTRTLKTIRIEMEQKPFVN